MINWLQISYLGFNVLLLVLIGLCVAVAHSKGRAHLTWLIPLAIARLMTVISSLSNLAFMASLRQGGFSNNPLRWLLSVEQALSFLGMLCLLWSAVALLILLQSLTPVPRGLPPGMGGPQEEGSWPPSPTTRQDR